MSGLISSVVSAGHGVFSFGQTISNFFSSGNGPLTIGTVQLSGFELPEMVPMGGVQDLAVNDYVGGRRNVSTKGAYEDDVEWGGIFFGPSAGSRFSSLDTMRVAGSPVAVSFGQYNYQVVIRKLVGRYRRLNHIEYTITVCVVAKPSASVASSTLPGILGVAAKDVSNAATYVQNLAAPVIAAVGTAQSALAQIAPSLAASPLFNNVLGAVSQANILVGAAGSLANGNISGLIEAGAVAGNLFGSKSVYQTASGVAGLVTAAGQLSGATTAAGYLGRSFANLTRATTTAPVVGQSGVGQP